jgi:hypothetical protein
MKQRINPFQKHYELTHYDPEIRKYLDKYPGVRKKPDESSEQYSIRMREMVKRGVDKMLSKKRSEKDTEKPTTKTFTFVSGGREITIDERQDPVPIEGSDKDKRFCSY